MNDLTNDNPIGQQVRKYRKERGWTLSANPKRGSSLMDEIKARFGEQTCERLTKRETFKNLETSGRRHIELTAKELYQVAATLEVPLLALLVDYDDPNAASSLDPDRTVYELAMEQGQLTRSFRHFDAMTDAESEARRFAKRCKRAIKNSTPEQIKEEVLGGYPIENVPLFMAVIDQDMNVVDLNGRGLQATYKTLEYYKEAEQALESVGISVRLPTENIINDKSKEKPLFIRQDTAIRNEEEETRQAKRTIYDMLKLIERNSHLPPEYAEILIQESKQTIIDTLMNLDWGSEDTVWPVIRQLDTEGWNVHTFFGKDDNDTRP